MIHELATVFFLASGLSEKKDDLVSSSYLLPAVGGLC